MLLDYGPRRFRVGFDESLQPTVHDEDGTRRKLLPRPSAQDDPALAEPAYARFASLKKDVRTVAAEQIRRLERAMADGRRWSADEHRALFVDHPLTVHLARRLVWVTVDEAGRVTGSFRIAEDRTYADSADIETSVPDGAAVGIAHPLDLPDLAAWSDLFADYRILQPFQQLGRETYEFPAVERAASTLDRYADLVVYTGRLLALGHRGWDRGTAHAYGVCDDISRSAGAGRRLRVHFTPGIEIGASMAEKEQTLFRIELTGGTFGDLDPILASEILRDLESLRG